VAARGSTLRASEGRWTGTLPMTFAYRWERCSAAGTSCSSISGAVGASYTPGRKDVGRALRVRVTAKNAAGSTTARSLATQPVASSAVRAAATLRLASLAPSLGARFCPSAGNRRQVCYNER